MPFVYTWYTLLKDVLGISIRLYTPIRESYSVTSNSLQIQIVIRALVLLLLTAPAGSWGKSGEITVYIAEKIITMDSRYPEAKVVAVRDGIVLSIGQDLEDLEPWLSQYEYHVDRTLEQKVLLPGFVDPHIHPLLAALFLPHHFAAPDDWVFPDKTVTGVIGREAFLERVAEGNSALSDPDEWLLVFGWAEAAHGLITRPDLDRISTTRPVAVSSRSTHSMILNSRALEVLELSADIAAGHPMQHEVDYEQGRFIESANFLLVVPRLSPVIFAPERLELGLTMLRDMAHRAGITTMNEPGAGMVAGGGDVLKEMRMMAPVLDREDTPFRTYLFPAAYPNMLRLGDIDKVMSYIDSLPSNDTDRIRFLPKKIKFLYDGSYVDQLGMYDAPGYIDGHEGVPIDPPELFASLLPKFWRAGYSIHVHVQGDRGARQTVEALAALQEDKPRFDHRFVLEHMGQASTETVAKAARLGASVSALVYPLHSMGDPFADRVLGRDRMEMAFPYREVLDRGMLLALHADTPVAPPNPLRNVWIAVNRQTTSGRVIGIRQALDVHEALRAITIDAAYILGLENEIGSIRAGKKADFAVLEKDPYAVKPTEIQDIPIWGTVFEGRLQPVVQ
jgi:predicted amidohydrolase YtcJ